MTKKHFIEFAREIAAMENRDHAKACADMVAKIAGRHNERFNVITFYSACGLVIPKFW